MADEYTLVEVAFRFYGDECETSAKVCRQKGVGFVVTLPHLCFPRAIAYLCSTCGKRAVESRRRLNEEVKFVRGVVEDGMIVLRAQWRFVQEGA